MGELFNMSGKVTIKLKPEELQSKNFLSFLASAASKGVSVIAKGEDGKYVCLAKSLALGGVSLVSGLCSCLACGSKQKTLLALGQISALGALFFSYRSMYSFNEANDLVNRSLSHLKTENARLREQMGTSTVTAAELGDRINEGFEDLRAINRFADETIQDTEQNQGVLRSQEDILSTQMNEIAERVDGSVVNILFYNEQAKNSVDEKSQHLEEKLKTFNQTDQEASQVTQASNQVSHKKEQFHQALASLLSNTSGVSKDSKKNPEDISLRASSNSSQNSHKKKSETAIGSLKETGLVQAFQNKAESLMGQLHTLVVFNSFLQDENDRYINPVHVFKALLVLETKMKNSDFEDAKLRYGFSRIILNVGEWIIDFDKESTFSKNLALITRTYPNQDFLNESIDEFQIVLDKAIDERFLDYANAYQALGSKAPVDYRLSAFQRDLDTSIGEGLENLREKVCQMNIDSKAILSIINRNQISLSPSQNGFITQASNVQEIQDEMFSSKKLNLLKLTAFYDYFQNQPILSKNNSFFLPLFTNPDRLFPEEILTALKILEKFIGNKVLEDEKLHYATRVFIYTVENYLKLSNPNQNSNKILNENFTEFKASLESFIDEKVLDYANAYQSLGSEYYIKYGLGSLQRELVAGRNRGLRTLKREVTNNLNRRN